MSCLISRMINGKTEISFVPIPTMYAFALMRSMGMNAHLSDHEVCELVNINRQTFDTWRRSYNPYFDEWLENFMITHTDKKLLKEMLNSVGIKKSLEGDFNFWKVIALREKVIEPETTNLKVIPANLGSFDDWTPEQIANQAASLMAALKPMDDSRELGMAEAADNEQSKSHSS